ncbi:hypothetical protein LWI28_010929 [Acer negundo]|uniref:Uncharacterized protein n=1 Tax=Acer negundo TaxID=4023 RepID=A0AAD5IMN9_ACENE|nr:hypothetical protein LWI28_010929 [Acer negundo]
METLEVAGWHETLFMLYSKVTDRPFMSHGTKERANRQEVQFIHLREGRMGNDYSYDDLQGEMQVEEFLLFLLGLALKETKHFFDENKLREGRFGHVYKLEKLGIRFRVTRKALKEPISQTATLAQKNSEATRTLAMQEEVLEKELGEIQKVLLAMQEQQHKQLDLILAIGKTGKLLESRREPSQEQITLDKSKLADGKTHETQSLGSIKGSKNDRV